jgi:hypothetical protein
LILRALTADKSSFLGPVAIASFVLPAAITTLLIPTKDRQEFAWEYFRGIGMLGIEPGDSIDDPMEVVLDIKRRRRLCISIVQ